MSDIKVIIEGKEYICSPVEEQAEEKPRTGYERVNEGSYCYYTNSADSDCMVDVFDEAGNQTYRNGNYYNDKQLAEGIARAETLMRRMRQWQALNDEPVNWNDDNAELWFIAYNCKEKKLSVFVGRSIRDVGGVYFTSIQAADKAREVFRDDLIWYFTEYRQRLDESPHIEGE